MDFELNEEQLAFAQAARDFARGEMAPHAQEWDEKKIFPRETLAAAGALAYSGADEAVDEFHSGTLRSSGTDTASHLVNIFGERFWFVNWFLVAAVDAWGRSGSFSSWGRNNFEAMVVGLPVLWTVQRGLGANRPSDENPNPRWRPMSDDNSASGHAFIAAIPWLNLARRTGNLNARWAARTVSVANHPVIA